MAGIWLYDDYNLIATSMDGERWLTTTAFQFEVIKNTASDTLARNGYLEDDERWERYMERMARNTFEERIAMAVHYGICGEGLDADTVSIDHDRETELGAQIEHVKSRLAQLGMYEVGDRFEDNIVALAVSITKIKDEVASVYDRQN